MAIGHAQYQVGYGPVLAVSLEIEFPLYPRGFFMPQNSPHPTPIPDWAQKIWQQNHGESAAADELRCTAAIVQESGDAREGKYEITTNMPARTIRLRADNKKPKQSQTTVNTWQHYKTKLQNEVPAHTRTKDKNKIS